ncbi:MAG TPA: DHA2 family efflux MFS transporter permease subunit, partial [Actinomycetota bacterium]
MAAPVAAQVRFSEPAGRWVVLATVLGSGLALLDATVVNVALPRIGEDLDADLGGLQWTLNGYTLTLAAFILLGGSLADRLGRRRVFILGTVWFAVASALCGLSPNVEVLIAARTLQGVGGALLTPGSLAIIMASFAPEDRGRAIGAWSGLGGIAGAAGPFAGGWLVEAASWRWVFLVNLPLAVVVVLVAARHVPESIDPTATGRLDVTGAALGAVGLAGITYASIAGGERGLDPAVVAAGLVGLLALVAFVALERRSDHPLVPPELFASRQFTVTNIATFAIYGAFGAVFFLLVLHLQVVAGFSPLAAGTAMLPVTLLLLVLSARSGALAARIGPRLPMAAGPL